MLPDASSDAPEEAPQRRVHPLPPGAPAVPARALAVEPLLKVGHRDLLDHLQIRTVSHAAASPTPA